MNLPPVSWMVPGFAICADPSQKDGWEDYGKKARRGWAGGLKSRGWETQN